MRKKCLVDGCDKDATPRTNFCNACRARNNYWLKKNPVERIERAKNLARWSAGMRLLDPDIVIAKPRKRTKTKIKSRLKRRQAI